MTTVVSSYALRPIHWVPLLAALLFAILAGLVLDRDRTTNAGSALAIESSYGSLPLSFMREGGGYAAATNAGSVVLDDRGATIVPVDGRRAGDPVSIGLVGASSATPTALGELPGVVNDLRGDDPSAWQTGIPTFERVRYAGVYPGVDLDYHGTTGTLEYDFRLEPGADPGQIGVEFGGAPARLTEAGALIVGTGPDAIRQAPPVAFQPSADGREPVQASFHVRSDRVGFELGAYDSNRPLVIDPLVLSYSTLLGGEGFDSAEDLAVDSTGAAYVAGNTASSDFPTTAGAYDQTRLDEQTYNSDAFVTKLNPSGTALVYSTYIGGFYSESANGIAVDSSGNAYVTGQTDSTRSDGSVRFPVTAGAYASSPNNGFDDVFVAKLNPSGSDLIYSSVFGGSGRDEATEIAIDGSGNAYLAGATSSGSSVGQTLFPTTGGALQSTYGGNSGDAFVTKLNATGTAPLFSTYLGGTGQDDASGIDIDSQGRPYVTGFSSAFSANTFPTTSANRYAAVDPNSADAFLTRLSANGANLEYSTAIGTDGNGSNDGADYGNAVAVGPTDGIAYIVGGTRTTGQSGADFPLKNQYEGRSGACCFGLDAFAAKFDTNASGASSLLYSTMLSSGGEEGATAVDVDSAGNAYVGGVVNATGSADPYDTTPDALTPRGNAFVTKLVQSGSANATLGFSTTIPGTSSLDGLGGVLFDETANAVYVAGTSRNGQVVTTPGAFDTTGNTSFDRDGYALKISVTTGPIDTMPPETTITAGFPNGSTLASGANVTFGFSANETSTFQCKIDTGPFTACSNPGPGTTGSDVRTYGVGPHTFQVRATDSAGNPDATPDQRTFTVNPPPDTTPPDTSITSGPAEGSTVNTSSATFGFSSTEGGSTFECSYDGGAFTACTSPGPGTTGADSRTLANGAHTFAVRARDAAGNADASPATRSFTVAVSSPPPPDTSPPDTTITKAPPAKIKSRRLPVTVELAFSSNEPGSTFSCKVDGGPATGCTSPAKLKLGKGKHTISVIATDSSNNADASPATAQVEVKKKKPKKPGGGKGGGKP